THTEPSATPTPVATRAEPSATPTSLPPNTPTATSAPAHLTLSPSVASYQQTIAITGSHFGPGDAISVFWDSTTRGLVTTTTANDNGAFVARFGVPQAISGTHTVVAAGQPSGKVASATIYVRGAGRLLPRQRLRGLAA